MYLLLLLIIIIIVALKCNIHSFNNSNIILFMLINYNLFSLVFLFLGVFTGYIIYFITDSKVLNNKYLLINITSLICFFFLFALSNNIFIVFFCYELLLIPSYFLIFFLSPNLRYIIVSLYFLIWTQVGSFLVLIYIIYLYSFYSVISLNDIVSLGVLELNFLFLMVYIGFGIKIPIWPFYYWLTKTHVEAPTFFSIYLSGFLVKTALLGFYKLTKVLVLTSYPIFSVIITLFSVLDSSLKMWIQVDLKKLVAFCTVQEMNMIFFLILFPNNLNFFLIVIFSLTHALLSSIFFFLVDILYKIYLTRNIFNLTGFYLFSPNLSILIFISVNIYNGLPFTLKFFCEIYVYQFLLDLNFLFFINTVFIVNFVGCIGISKCWYNIIFSSSKTNFFKISDLTKKEAFLLIFLNMFLIFGSLFTLFFF